MSVQGRWAQGPAPGGHTRAAFLELKQRGEKESKEQAQKGLVEGPHKNGVGSGMHQDIEEPSRGGSHRTLTHQAIGIVHVRVISVLLQEG